MHVPAHSAHQTVTYRIFIQQIKKKVNIFFLKLNVSSIEIITWKKKKT